MDNNPKTTTMNINEKPLKVLGILSAVGVVSYIITSILNRLNLSIKYELYDMIIPSEISIKYYLYLIFASIPFILFCLYAFLFSNKKANHPLLWISYIALAIFGLYEIFIDYGAEHFFKYLFNDLIVTVESLIDLSFNDYIYSLSTLTLSCSYLLFTILPILFVIDINTNFKITVISRLAAALISAVIILDCLIWFFIMVVELISETGSYTILNVILLFLEVLMHIPFFLFWFVGIKKGSKKDESKPQTVQPVSRSVYQTPVQPVYQAPVKPVAQQIYQTPAQPVVQNPAPFADSRNNQSKTTLITLKEMLDEGLITQEDFDKKKAEILEKM